MMRFGLSTTLFDTAECVVIGVFGDSCDTEKVIPTAHLPLVKRLMSKLIHKGDTICHAFLGEQSLLMIHCGDQSDWSLKGFKKALKAIAHSLFKQHTLSATIALPQLSEKSADWQVQNMLLHLADEHYQLFDLKTGDIKPHRLENVLFYLPGATEQSIVVGSALVEGVNWTKTLANLPANICTPTYVAKQAMTLAEHFPECQVKVLNREDAHALGMHAFLSVANGSIEPPQFIEIQYHVNQESPVVLVGKGVTFDSGGISLKPALRMEDMKFDMSGAASILGTLKACALLKLPIHIVALLPITENMPSGTATRPGDIVTSMSKQTIEIINTDAEGRLILADALTYAERFKPKFVLDIATLTGAVMVALGQVFSGLMTNDEELAKRIEKAGIESDDRVWRLPLDDEYQEAIDSHFADIKNSTEQPLAGSITAGCFLSRFTKAYRWAHLDIAGSAWPHGKHRQATGRPVPLLFELLQNVIHSR